eukprot:jgi/Tetstr1/446724/TSEL_034212.t1
MTEGVVPLVDLSGQEEETVAALRDAATTAGFFYLANHGVPPELMAAQLAQQRALFSLPMEAKMAMLADKRLNRGYTPFKEETLDPGVQSVGDTKEGFYIGPEAAAGADAEEAAAALHGPNRWPDPQALPEYRAVVSEYIQQVTQLGHRMLHLLALSLDLPRTWFDDKFDDPLTILRPLHYSAEVSRVEDGVFGAGAHTDYGMLTFLLTDERPGLQIFHEGTWMDVPPQTGGVFVVNIGDMLHRWTNGRYKSTLHRVINAAGRERYSTAFFFEPNFHATVDCLPSCCQGEAAKFPAVKYGDHILGKYQQTHANFSDEGAG